MVNRILFRCNAGSSVGGGHMVRCIALAKEFKARGAVIYLATLNESQLLFPDLVKTFDDISYLDANSVDHVTSFLNEFNVDSFDVIFIDDHNSNVEYEEQFEHFSTKLVILSDNPTNRHKCDYLIDSNFDRKSEDYLEYIDPECRLLLGPDFVILRDEFTHQTKSIEDTKNILISVGYTDPADLSVFYLKSLIETGSSHPVDIVIGHAPETLLQLHELQKEAHFSLVIHKTPKDLYTIMSRAFVALGSGGGSVWERCAMGLPSLTIEVASNQTHLLTALHQQGALLHIGAIEHITQQYLSDQMTKFIRNTTMHKTMSKKARSFCDGKGVVRIVDTIMKAL